MTRFAVLKVNFYIFHIVILVICNSQFLRKCKEIIEMQNNGDFIVTDKVVSEGGHYVPKIFDVSGTLLNSYS